jgi:hypothetical protein
MTQFKKGESGNPKGRPVEQKAQTGAILASGYITPASTQNEPDPYIQKKVEDTRNKPYQYFGSDNLFPDAVADLTRKSPSHRGILANKVLYCVGKGFSTEDVSL